MVIKLSNAPNWVRIKKINSTDFLQSKDTEFVVYYFGQYYLARRSLDGRGLVAKAQRDLYFAATNTLELYKIAGAK